MTKNHPIRCQCGKLQAEVSHPEFGTRVVCYCRDCQAFAHYLGSPQDVLDVLGGTDIVAIRPRYLSFTSGVEHLSCMSLTEHGMLRWYTNCCQTPIGNTPRDFKMSHLGLIHTCLERSGIELDTSFGSVKMYVSRENAKGQPASAPITTFIAAVIRYLSSLTWSRISGKYKHNPLFDRNTGRPIKEPKLLTTDEHKQLMHTVEVTPLRQDPTA